MATTPNASVTTLPPIAIQAPCANGSRNVAVIGPDATPPESNAIAVNIFGHKECKYQRYGISRYPENTVYVLL